MANDRPQARSFVRSNRLSRLITDPGMLAIFFALVLVLVVLVNPELLKDLAVRALGDEGRDQLIALYTSAITRVPETDDMVPIAHTGVNPFGVNVFLEQEVEESEIRRTLQMIKDAGFGWVKQQVLWSEIEIPRKGTYVDEKNGVENTWLKYDRIVDLVNEYGLNLIARLDTSPPWARKGSSKIETPPDNFEDYGDFVFSVVSRYKDRVKYYMIWNEPNTSFEWGDRPVNAKEYVRLLKIAYRRAKEADSKAVIIAAPLAPTIEISSRAINDVIFLQQMYDAGAKDYFDIMSANPYGLRSGPYDRRVDSDKDVNFSRPMLLREVMVRNGDANKPIWGAEMGWNALPADFPEEPLFGRVTREQQARYTVAGLRRILEEWPWMGVVNLWHFRRVHPVNQQEQMYYFGLVGQDFTPFPVYDAVKRLTSAMPIAYRGFHQEDHWALRFSEGWSVEKSAQASLGQRKVAYRAGERIEFVFRGTHLSIISAKGPRVGDFHVSVDGQTPNLLRRDGSGVGITDLRAAEPKWQQVVPIVSDLPYGEHKVEILTAASSDSVGELVWYFDGFIVDGRQTNWAAVLFWPSSATILGLVLGFALAHTIGMIALVCREVERN